MFHALAPAHSGAMNNFATSLPDDSFHNATLRFEQNRRPATWYQRRENGTGPYLPVFFSLQRTIFSSSNYRFIRFQISTMYFALFMIILLMKCMGGRANETWNVHTTCSSSIWCVGRRRYNVCHNSGCIRAELLHYNLALYVIYLRCHVLWMILYWNSMLMHKMYIELQWI